MKYLKKIVYISCFILTFLLLGNYVQAENISAEDYFSKISEYGYSQPYEALGFLSEAHKLYPEDQRFIDGLNGRAKVILDWSKGSQISGSYGGAIYGYNTIINTEGVSQHIKDEANICFILASRREQGAIGRIRLPEDFDLVEKYQQDYIKSNYEYPSLVSYDSFGNYLFIENSYSFTDTNNIRFDYNGIPMASYPHNFYYNPVTIAQYSLTLYDKYLKEEYSKKQSLKNEFLKVANWLVDDIDRYGAFRYSFKYKHYLDDEELNEGWVSAMAQGQSLSVFARAYHLTNNSKYVNAGNKVFGFLTKRTYEGGATDDLRWLNESLRDHVFFQLYVTNPPSYTLNGHMFTLIGLYDWSNIRSNGKVSNEAKVYFDKGIETLRYMLPYYDIGGMVTYDLGYLTKPGTKPTVNLGYYGIHLTLLDALYRITNDKEIQYYRNLWTSYVVKY